MMYVKRVGKLPILVRFALFVFFSARLASTRPQHLSDGPNTDSVQNHAVEISDPTNLSAIERLYSRRNQQLAMLTRRAVKIIGAAPRLLRLDIIEERPLNKNNEEKTRKLLTRTRNDVSSTLYGEFNVDSGLGFAKKADGNNLLQESTAKSTSSSASSEGEGVKTLTKQLMQQPAAVEMVATDIRTPPKIMSQIAHTQATAPAKGEAIPIILDEVDQDAFDKFASIQDNILKYTHQHHNINTAATSPSGISTWILLNSDSSSTPYNNHHSIISKLTHKPTKTFEGNNKTGITVENLADQLKRVKPLTTKDQNSTSSTTTTTTTTEKIIFTIKNDNNSTRKPERRPLIGSIQKLNQTAVKKIISSTTTTTTTGRPTTTITADDLAISSSSSSSLYTTISLQDSKFKNKTPVVVGKVPLKPTTDINHNDGTTIVSIIDDAAIIGGDKVTRLGTPVITFPHVPPRQRPSITSSASRKPQNKHNSTSINNSANNFGSFQQVPNTTATVVVTVSADLDTATTTTSTTIVEVSKEATTTKKSTSLKKKKKNKNKKRKRPSKKNNSTTKIQSKIVADDDHNDNTTTLSSFKLPGSSPNRPLSTRIYNYLAREVMPNVGVGLVGLMLTAGLAGLFLYPFGGGPVPIRRNYEKPHPSSHGLYSNNINDYPPIGEIDNGQPEESVFGQVLAGMNHFSREQPDIRHSVSTPGRYKPPPVAPGAANNQNNNNNNNYISYNNINQKEPNYDDGPRISSEEDINNKYSDLGDVVSGPHESVKFTNFDNTDHTKYSTIDKSHPVDSYVDLTTTNENKQIDLTNSYTLTKTDVGQDLYNKKYTSNQINNNVYNSDHAAGTYDSSYTKHQDEIIVGHITYGSNDGGSSAGSFNSNNNNIIITNEKSDVVKNKVYNNAAVKPDLNSYSSSKPDDKNVAAAVYNEKSAIITADDDDNENNDVVIKTDYNNYDDNSKFTPIKEIASPNMHDPTMIYSNNYASYNNPSEPVQHPVYTGETYSADYLNHKVQQNSSLTTEKFAAELEVITTKSADKPIFEALEGIPKNYRTLDTSITIEDDVVALPSPDENDFVPIIGLYNNNRQGSVSSDRGPRMLNLHQQYHDRMKRHTTVEHQHAKSQQHRKRNTYSENEVDSELQDLNIIPDSVEQRVQQPNSTESSSENSDSSTTMTTAAPDNNEMANDVDIDALLNSTLDSATTSTSAADQSISTEEDDVTMTSNPESSSATETMTRIPDSEESGIRSEGEDEAGSTSSTDSSSSSSSNSSIDTTPTSGGTSKLSDSGTRSSTTTTDGTRITDSTSDSSSSKLSTKDEFNIDNIPSATEEPPKRPAFSLTTLFQKIFDFKLKLGLELIRSTTEAISKYISTVQHKMVEAVREMQRTLSSKSQYSSQSSDDNSARTIIRKRDRFYFPFG